MYSGLFSLLSYASAYLPGPGTMLFHLGSLFSSEKDHFRPYDMLDLMLYALGAGVRSFAWFILPPVPNRPPYVRAKVLTGV